VALLPSPSPISPHFNSLHFEGDTVQLQDKQHMVRRAERAVFKAASKRGAREDDVIAN